MERGITVAILAPHPACRHSRCICRPAFHGVSEGVKAPARTRLHWLGLVLLTLVAGTAGGALFHAMGLPAPWLSGAMVFTIVLAVGGVDVHLPEPLRHLALLILGVSMGAALTPQMVARAAAWPVTMAFLALSVAATMAGGIMFLRRVGRWDGPTAFFAAAPGAFSTVIALASDTGADLRRVAFAQAVRLFLLIAALPGLLRAAGLTRETPLNVMADEADPAALSLSDPAGLMDLGLLLALSAAGGYLAERARIPGGLILGALIVSGALHLGEWSHTQLPPSLLLPAFILLGVNVGTRFVGTRISTIVSFFAVSLGAFVVSIVISAAFALMASQITGDDFGKVLTAYAPGALEAMAALGFALGYDPAYMSAHHVFRFAGLSIALPLIARLLFRILPKS